MIGKDEYGMDASRTRASDLLDDPAAAGDPVGSNDQVAEIRESIEHTRAGMSETIDELQERLSPSHLKEQVREQVMEHYQQARDMVREATIGKVKKMAYQTRRTVAETVSANPIPSALVGIGLAWLWMNRRTDNGSASLRYQGGGRSMDSYDEWPDRYAAGRTGAGIRGGYGGDGWDGNTDAGRNAGGRMGGKLDDVKHQVQETAGQVADRAKDTLHRAQESASHLMDQAQYQARRVEDRFSNAMRENPLALGAVALAVGTAVGLALPQTRKENEWMGDARDSVLDKAQSVAHEALDQAQQVAQKVTSEMGSSGDNRSQGQQSGML